MALIENFRFEEKQIKVQEAADTSYSIGYLNGQTYLQINMYGSCHRQFTEKASQIIQLDKSSATKLVEILKKTFYL